MKRLLLGACLLFMSTGCIPNSPIMLWHGVGVSDVDVEHAHTGALDTDEAWCSVPAFQGGDGTTEATTVADAMTRPYPCYPTQDQAEKAWELDRAVWAEWRDTTP